jgi:hypothetical protein
MTSIDLHYSACHGILVSYMKVTSSTVWTKYYIFYTNGGQSAGIVIQHCIYVMQIQTWFKQRLKGLEMWMTEESHG